MSREQLIEKDRASVPDDMNRSRLPSMTKNTSGEAVETTTVDSVSDMCDEAFPISITLKRRVMGGGTVYGRYDSANQEFGSDDGEN